MFDAVTLGAKTKHMMDSLSVKYHIPVTNVTGAMMLVGRLLPAGLVAVTLNVYISHSVEFIAVITSSLVIVMLVSLVTLMVVLVLTMTV